MSFFYVVLALAGAYVLVACIVELVRKPLSQVSRDNALEAAKLVKDWGVWMATICTAAIAANGLVISGLRLPGDHRSVVLLLFALTILFDAWVLGALPSLVGRLKKDDDAANDIYEAKMHSFLWCRFTRIGFIGNLQHTCFVLAIIVMADGICHPSLSATMRANG